MKHVSHNTYHVARGRDVRCSPLSLRAESDGARQSLSARGEIASSLLLLAMTLAAFAVPSALHAQAPTDVGSCVFSCLGSGCPTEAEARASCASSSVGDSATGVFTSQGCSYVATREECAVEKAARVADDTPTRRTAVDFISAAAQASPPTTGSEPRSGGRYGLNNPLGTVNIPVILGRFVSAAIGLVGAIFLVMLIYGGFVWMTAGGDSKKVATARKTLINAVLGILVVALSYTFVTVIFQYAATLAG